jgi:hypothetical protein
MFTSILVYGPRSGSDTLELRIQIRIRQSSSIVYSKDVALGLAPKRMLFAAAPMANQRKNTGI